MSALFPDFRRRYMERYTTPINRKLSLVQHQNMLAYGTDAFLLYAYLRRNPSARAVELGSGSGVISLLAASSEKHCHITAIEVQPSEAALTEENVIANRLSDRITTVCANVRDLSPTMVGGEVDVVFSNPPYMTVRSGKQNCSASKFIARHEVLGNIADFCMAAKRILKFGGSFYVVWRPDRLPTLFSALDSAGLAPKRMTYICADAVHSPSLILLEAKKGGSAEGFFCTKPLLLHEDATIHPLTDTHDCKLIYETGDFPDEYIRP